MVYIVWVTIVVAMFNSKRESISRYLQGNKKQGGHLKLAIIVGVCNVRSPLSIISIPHMQRNK
jgi:hypothetical protein